MPGGGKNPEVYSFRKKSWEKFAHHCLTGGLEKFQREMDKLDGKDYVQSFLMMLKFLKPQFANVQLTDKEGQTLTRPIINIIQLPGQEPQILNKPDINLSIEQFDQNNPNQTKESIPDDDQ